MSRLEVSLISDYISKINDNSIKYVDGHSLKIDGKYHNEKSYYRLSASDQAGVPEKIWQLGKNSSGLSVCFTTNSKAIYVKWELGSEINMSNMNPIGVSGLDLYTLNKDKWQYINSAVPIRKSSKSKLIDNMDGKLRSYCLYLPLYNNVKSLSIGIDKESLITSSKFLGDEKPVVIFGTSITQGASASRPGLCYTNILSRKMNRPVINLGFSGNGRFQKSVGEIICKTRPSLVVIDCTPNSSQEVINKNAFALISQIRSCYDSIPIYIVESIMRENAYFNTANESVAGSKKYIEAQNYSLKKVYNKAKKIGIKNLYYIPNNNLIRDDHEGTVDGTHLNDLGNKRYAETIYSYISNVDQEN